MKPKPEPMTLFTTSEAARHLEISVETVRRYEKAGKLIAIKTGRGERLFTSDELRRFIVNRAANSEHPKTRKTGRGQKVKA